MYELFCSALCCNNYFSRLILVLPIYSERRSELVEYKEFYETKDDIFPTASLCLGHPFLKEKLAEYGANETTYLDFLSGTTYAKEMLNINFSYVTIDIIDYIKGYQLYFKNDTALLFDTRLTFQQKKMLTFNSFNGFSGSLGIFYKCFALNLIFMGKALRRK